MDLNNKVKGLPTIYYVNLDNRTDRREYMESQFDYWKIKNFKRISATKYLASNHENWKDIYIQDFSYYQNSHQVIGHFVTVLELIKEWLETTNDPFMIIFEDDINLCLIEYWHFDWNYLMNHIPYDWDCIQLGFISLKYYPFFLHPKTRHSYYGPCMINRHYAEKLIKLHYYGGKYKIYNRVSDINFIDPNSSNFFSSSATVDYAITHSGRTYAIPILGVDTSSPSFENYEQVYKPEFLIIEKIVRDWWKNKRDNFTLEDFFTYGKPYDHLMTEYVNYPSAIGIYGNEELLIK